MAKVMEALGMIEAKGFVTLVEATDAASRRRTFNSSAGTRWAAAWSACF